MGAADWGTWSWDPGPTPWVRGSIYKKKGLQHPYTHSGHNTQRSFDPPPTPLLPPLQKRGTWVRRGTGVKIQKIIFGPKMMILQGVRR